MNKLKILLTAFIVVAVSSLLFWYYSKPQKISSIKTPSGNPKPSQIVEKKKVTCLLDGTEVEEDLANQHPVAVMVENSLDARPQVGLNEAQIVYEAVAEGGITRFMAIYSCAAPEKVGPVRSARTYYLDWLSEYNAFYAHVGGNWDALQKIKEYKILDLDQFRYGAAAYWRVPQAGKAIEHTMYTSVKKLLNIAKKNKWDMTGSYQTWEFKDDLAKEQRPATNTVTIDFSTPNYQVKWIYDPETNTYTRSQTKGPSIKAKNVVIQWTEKWPVVSKIGEKGYAMKTVGTGKAKILIDGKVIEGSWSKSERTSRTWFYDSSGQKIKFNRGQIWIEIVQKEMPVKIK